MTPQDFANIYVNYIEPGMKFFMILVVIICALWLLNTIRDGDKKKDLINTLFEFLVNSIKAMFVGIGLVFVWVFSFLFRIVTVIFASIRDFFTSKV